MAMVIARERLGGRYLDALRTAIGRHKGLIGPKLSARGLPAQQGEAAIAVEVLNRMIRGAKPASVRVA